MPRLYDKTVRGILIEVVEVAEQERNRFELRMDNQTKEVSDNLDTILNRFHRIV